MPAGQYRHRISVLRKGAGGDGWNKPTPAPWEPFLTNLPADVREPTGTQAIRADAVTSSVKASIRIRFRQDIDASMRVQHGEDLYAVQAVLKDARRRHVDLVCELAK